MRLIPIASLFVIAGGAMAESAPPHPVAANAEGCLVYPASAARATARWTGPCKDGYADGEGTLAWSLKAVTTLTYSGPMKRGRYHGVGYTRAQDNSQYEGEFVDGQRHGFGISVSALGDRYDGEWKVGRREGKGKMVYALGGSYEGGWRADAYHGKGTIVYAGGRRAEYDFVDGHWPDKITPVGKRGDFSVTRASDARPSLRSEDIAAHKVPVPPELPWERLSPEHRNVLATVYPLMDPADEPPYPAAGAKGLLHVLSDIHDAGSGVITVLVKVGPDGKAESVTTLGSPSANTTKVVQYAFMLEKYKPATCAGVPCAMVYPARFEFQP